MTENSQIENTTSGPRTASALVPVTTTAGTGAAGLHPAADAKKIIRFGMITIIAIFGGFGAWSAVAKLSSAVIGVGAIKVESNRKTVQHLEGGIVKEILVRDGDHVDAGQVLIVIEDERVEASVDVLRGQLDAEMAKAARLLAERDELAAIRFPPALTERADDPEVAELIKTGTNYFETRRRILDSQISLLQEKITQIEEEIKNLTLQVRSEEAAGRFLAEEIEANEELEKKKYVQKNRILDLKRTVEDYRSRRGNHLAEIARARQRIIDMRLRIVGLRDQYVESAAQELTGKHATGVQAKIFDLQARYRAARDAQRRQQIVAPITGTVVDLRVFTVGGVITPRQPLMDIVPDDKRLIVEAKISLESIKSVHAGQTADIRLTAYKRRSTPLVAGTVTYVSADRLTDPRTEEGYYLAHIDIDRQSLKEAGDLELYPGMSAEVFIRTGERTALDYMLAPLTASMRRSFREP